MKIQWGPTLFPKLITEPRPEHIENIRYIVNNHIV